MAITGHLEQLDAAAGRPRERRRKLQLEAQGALPSGNATPILIHDISATGLLLESSAQLTPGERIGVELPHAGTSWATVIWASSKLYGCQFEEPISTAALSAAQLRSAVGQPVDIAAPAAAPAPSMPRPDASFGDRLQRLRKARGISQSDIAARLGVSKPTVWAWEHGKARPIGSRIADLAELLGVTDADLLASGPASDAESVVARSREQIAAAYGMRPENVKIWVEL